MARERKPKARFRWTMLMLKESLQALSMPFAIQHNLYEDFVNVEDELALEFDNWQQVILENFADKLTHEQRTLLQQIDAKFDEMSDKLSKEVWSCEALRSSPEWEEIREMARKALKSLHWSVAIPQVSCTVQSKPPRIRDGALEELSGDWVRQILRTGRLSPRRKARSGVA